MSYYLTSGIGIPSCQHDSRIHIVIVHFRHFILQSNPLFITGVSFSLGITDKLPSASMCILQISSGKSSEKMYGPYLSLMLILYSFLINICAKLDITSSLRPRYVEQCTTLPFTFMILAVVSCQHPFLAPNICLTVDFLPGYWIVSSLNINLS